jgi:hypothetical protein
MACATAWSARHALRKNAKLDTMDIALEKRKQSPVCWVAGCSLKLPLSELVLTTVDP